MLSGDKDHVAHVPADQGKVGNIERLGIDITINGIGEKLPEITDVDIGRGKNRFGQIITGAAVVIMVSQHIRAAIRQRHG
jgi:hypothetical protein